MASATATGGTAVGYQALQGSTTGTNNTAVGFEALSGVSTTGNNTALGMWANFGAAGGGATAIGMEALFHSTGSNNTGLGLQAGTALTSGVNNTILGALVGTTTLATGGNNILLGTGSDCDASAAGASNEFHMCLGGGDVWQVTGGGTPSTSISNVKGVLNVIGAIEHNGNPIILTGITAAIGGSPLAAGACSSGTASITGAASTMSVAVTPSAAAQVDGTHGLSIYGYVSSANTVTVEVCAIVSTTPNSVTYNVRVFN